MTSDLKCPFCQTELEYEFGYDGDYSCRKCGRNKMFGSEELWHALIQAKQDLEIARDAITDVFGYVKEHEKDIGGCAVNIVIKLGLALEQIEHKVKDNE